MMTLHTRDNVLFAHKANIQRYRKILETFLTAEEEGCQRVQGTLWLRLSSSAGNSSMKQTWYHMRPCTIDRQAPR
jgi:hypothetical protein